jgi:hypothetical protein
LISGWLADQDCPGCGGPLLDTSEDPHTVTLECPECAYCVTWPTTDPGDKETE